MEITKLGVVETRFAELIWENEPLSSTQLVRICQKELLWKKPTTYTVLRKLCERGLFQNQSSIVTSRIPRDEYYARQCEQFVADTFEGSLPAFFAAFTTRKQLSPAEVEQLQQMIDRCREENR